jgi:hypothetical protein
MKCCSHAFFSVQGEGLMGGGMGFKIVVGIAATKAINWVALFVLLKGTGSNPSKGPLSLYDIRGYKYQTAAGNDSAHWAQQIIKLSNNSVILW